MRKKRAQVIMEKLQKDYNSYASSFARSRDFLWPEMRFLFDDVKQGEKVLDLGCGNGRFSQYLEHAEYTGVDFSPQMIKEAKKRFPEKRFIKADALDLPFPDNSFNRIYAIALIHHIPSTFYRKKVFKEMKRVLVPGGCVFVTAWNIWKRHKFFDSKNIKRMLLSPFFGLYNIFLKRGKYYHIFRKGELSSLARKTGFIVVEEDVVEKENRSNFYLIAQLPQSKN